MLRGDKETPNALVEPAIVEGQRSSCNNGINSDPVAEVVCKDDSFIALHARDKMASTAEGSHAWIDEDALTGIEKFLMNESDDTDLLGLPEKDINFDC